MKIKGNEVLWKSEKGNVAVAFSQFDMGDKYKVYHKVSYLPENIETWAYAYAYGTMGEAMNCARKIPDNVVVR